MPADSSITPLEWHAGVVLPGPHRAAPPVPAWSGRERERTDPRTDLEAAVARDLRGGPCAIQFSGGRDSSLVLAVALHVARRDGFPLPRVVTLRYEDAPDTDESAWQDLVAAHLGVPLEIVVVPRGGDDVAGPLGAQMVQLSGPFFPAPAGVGAGRLAPLLAGHKVLTGQGGDGVLGQQRVTAFTGPWKARHRPNREISARVGNELVPRRLRAHRLAAHLRPEFPWLVQDAARTVSRGLARHVTGQPWDWRTATWGGLGEPMLLAGLPHLDRAASAVGLRWSHPLLDVEFVESLCRAAGFWGFSSRTAAMSFLARDLLPVEVIRRQTKATFTQVYNGPWTRRFAAQWDGSGVDPAIVRTEALQAAWTADIVPHTSNGALQLSLAAAVAAGTWQPEGPAPP